MAVCAFIIIAGFVLFRPENMVPFAPMGMPGIVRGSSAAFFGYLGYDEVRGRGKGKEERERRSFFVEVSRRDVLCLTPAEVGESGPRRVG